jgi:hypothetical protein
VTLLTIPAAAEKLAWAASFLPDVRTSTSVVAPISPTAVVVGPPRMNTRGYGGALTAQWNVYLVVSVSQYAVDELLNLATKLIAAIEKYTPAVVMSSGPGTYPNPGGGVLPAYVAVVQMEVTQ